jgi:heme A synthase
MIQNPDFYMQKTVQAFHHTATVTVLALKMLEAKVEPHGNQALKFRLLLNGCSNSHTGYKNFL